MSRRAGSRSKGGTTARRRASPVVRAKPRSGLPGWLRRPNPWLVAAVLAAAHLLLALAVFDPTVFTGGDNAAYLALARSLLERHTYTSTWEPLTPPHTQYPPVFPGMIALGLLVGIRSWVGIKLMVVLCSTVAVAATYLWLRRRRRPGLALGVAALLALSPGVLAQSHLELSDVPFWAFAMVALWAFERLGPRERLRFGIAVAAVVLAYFTRSAGLPLVLAALAWLVWRRRWKQLVILAGVFVPLAFLWWYRGHGQGGSEYVQLFWYVDPYRPALGRIGFGELFHRVFANGRSYLNLHLPVLLAEQPATPLVLASYAIVALAVFGWAMRLRRPQLAEIYFPLYIGLLLVWPEVWAGERFLLPAFPLLLAYAGDGGARILRRLERRLVLPAAVAATALLAILAVPAIRTDAAAASLCRAQFAAGSTMACLDPEWQDYFQIAGWASAGLPQDAAVFSRKPRLFFVYSGRRSHDIPRTQDARQFLDEAREQHVRYVVVDRLGSLTLEYFGPIVSQHPDAFCLVQATQDGAAAILKMVPDAANLLQGPPHPTGPQLSLQSCATP